MLAGDRRITFSKGQKGVLVGKWHMSLFSLYSRTTEIILEWQYEKQWQ
jgi:hypothetical protein